MTLVGPENAISFLRRPTMHSSAQMLTATILIALLAALGSFEHLLHDVTHHAGSDAHSCGCHQTEQDACSNEQPPIKRHDPETCSVCRHLALPQLVDTPQQIYLSTYFTCDDVVAGVPSVTCPTVTLVPIRGPPLNELSLLLSSCPS